MPTSYSWTLSSTPPAVAGALPSRPPRGSLHATSEVQICNFALARVGVSQYIQARTDANERARSCDLFFDLVRDALFEMFPWPFAMRRSALALSASTRSGWGYTYGLPDDCLAAREVYSGSRTPTNSTRVAYAVEANDDGTGRLLPTDQTAPELLYTARVSDVAMWPATFCDAVGYRLALEIMMPLSVKPELRPGLEQAFKMCVAEAMAAAGRNRQEDVQPDSELIAARL